jgi:hypothetical protein
MGTWGTAIKDNDTFADIYDDFFELYNKGEEPDDISKKIIADNWEMLEIEEDKNNVWFALALTQWETKSLRADVLSKVEDIITSGHDLKIWYDLEASEQDIKKRKIVLDKFLEKLRLDKPKAKPRKKKKLYSPIFATGDCLIFKMDNGNYGGAVVLSTDTRPETAYNLIATTRLNLKTKPTPNDIENAEALISNYGNWEDKPEVTWVSPDFYEKEYSDIYENVGKINVELAYDVSNYNGKGYLFYPKFSAGWHMKYDVERQLESEKIKPKPEKKITIKQLTKNKKWWNFFN